MSIRRASKKKSKKTILVRVPKKSLSKHYIVSVDVLTQLSENNNSGLNTSLALTFFSIAVGVFFPFKIEPLTVSSVTNYFVGLFFIYLSIDQAIKAIRKNKKSQKLIRSIKRKSLELDDV